MTVTILVDTDTISDKDLANNVLAANRALAHWAPTWGVTVVVTSDKTQLFDMVAHITNDFRHSGAYGYHTVENGVKTYNTDRTHSIVPPKDHIPAGSVPTTYVSPAALLGNMYGTFTPAHWSKVIWNLLRTKITRAAKQTSPNRYREGIVSVLVHELMEMTADSHIDKLSSPDSTGACWLIEVADHVNGYFVTDKLPDGTVCVTTPGTFPSYYNLKGVKPFDSMNMSKTPFDTTSPGFYGYTKDAKSALIPVVKGTIHHL